MAVSLRLRAILLITSSHALLAAIRFRLRTFGSISIAAPTGGAARLPWRPLRQSMLLYGTSRERRCKRRFITCLAAKAVTEFLSTLMLMARQRKKQWKMYRNTSRWAIWLYVRKAESPAS